MLSLFGNIKYSIKQKTMINPRSFPSIHDHRRVTIFIHGTLFPLISKLVHKVDCPLGITSALSQGNKYVLGRIGYTLHQAAANTFPLESFYLYGWPGTLSYKTRLHAAEELYQYLKGYKGHITIIGHSHGCNVALYLAKMAEKHQDKNFKVDRLVFLACPVQEATAHYATSSVFKKIVSLYSITDFVQVCDPQGLYQEALEHRKMGKRVPFFSSRVFSSIPRLVQARVLLNWQNPAHIDFMLSKFIHQLPATLTLLEDAPRQTGESHFIVNIPTYDKKPSLVPPAPGCMAYPTAHCCCTHTKNFSCSHNMNKAS
jgi:hypothetical protein